MYYKNEFCVLLQVIGNGKSLLEFSAPINSLKLYSQLPNKREILINSGVGKNSEIQQTRGGRTVRNSFR